MKNKRNYMLICLLGLAIVFLAELFVCQTFFTGLRKGEQKNAKQQPVFHGQTAEDPHDQNILLIGSDSRGEDRGRSDSLMIAHYDEKKKQAKFVSIMRDCYVEIPGHGQNKINAAYSYGGVELVRQTVLKNFGIPLNSYLIVNFQDFKEMIDQFFPKGLKLHAEKSIELDGVTLKQGLQRMNGNQVLQYARFRHDADSDFGRVRRQQQVMRAIAEQAPSMTNFFKAPRLLGEMIGKIETNIKLNQMGAIAQDFILKKVARPETLSIPVEHSWEFADFEEAGSVLLVDYRKNREAIQTFLKE